MKNFGEYYNEISNNEAQKSAVDSEENTVVIAGPGSGKTRIVSMKAALLHLQKRGVACISFGNPTKQRIVDNLLDMGIRESEGLFIGTVHGFCLQHIVYPFIGLIDSSWNQDFSIASQEYQIPEILEIAKREQKYFDKVDLPKLQRKITANEEIASNERKALDVVILYEKLMLEQNLVDFEMIIRWAVDAVERSEHVRSYIRYHFEWFIIDEYQDLGAGLHRLAKLLVERVGVKLLAVGDLDQLIFEFNGSDKKYLQEFVGWSGDPHAHIRFKMINTTICYRFGRKLIAASAGALRKLTLGYMPDTKVVKSEGKVEFHEIASSDVTHLTDYVAESILPTLLSRVQQASEIAILYTRKGDIVDAIRSSLAKSRTDCIDEKDSRLPSSPVVTWIRQCADWVLAYSNRNNLVLNSFPDLASVYIAMVIAAGVQLDEDDISAREKSLRQILITSSSYDMNAERWLEYLVSNLRLFELLEQARNCKGDIRDIEELLKIVSSRTVSELAANAMGEGIILTTIHGAKGREFDYVILIGMQHGEIPWEKHENSVTFRNQFYVACTRARQELHFVYSRNLKRAILTSRGLWCPSQPPSPYLDDVRAALMNYERAAVI